MLVLCHAWKCVPTVIFGGIHTHLWGPWVSFVLTDEFSLRVTKITLRIGVSWATAYFSDLFLTQWNMAIPKGCKADNFKSHNSLKLSFTNIQVLYWNFAECESFVESNSPDILALCETNLDNSNWFWQFLCERNLPLNLKD